MIKRSFLAPLAAAGLSVMLTACGGGSNSSTTTTTNTGNHETGGTQAKTPNVLHKVHNAMSGRVLNINLGAMNNSKQDGSAKISESGKGVMVSIAVANEPKGAKEPAHIHQGTCAKLNPAPYKPLHEVAGGKSDTLLGGLTIAQLKKGHFAINVHKSAADLKTYVSCGDITP